MASAIQGVSAQFLAQEEQGGGGGASQLVGGGWGGAERRLYRAAMAVAQVYWEEDGEERKSESNERERRKRGRGIQVPSGGRLVVRRQAGGGHAGHLAASTQLLKVEDKGQICEKPPGFGVFS
jgi:hypothetical protein